MGIVELDSCIKFRDFVKNSMLREYYNSSSDEVIFSTDSVKEINKDLHKVLLNKYGSNGGTYSVCYLNSVDSFVIEDRRRISKEEFEGVDSKELYVYDNSNDTRVCLGIQGVLSGLNLSSYYLNKEYILDIPLSKVRESDNIQESIYQLMIQDYKFKGIDGKHDIVFQFSLYLYKNSNDDVIVRLYPSIY